MCRPNDAAPARAHARPRPPMCSSHVRSHIVQPISPGEGTVCLVAAAAMIGCCYGTAIAARCYGTAPNWSLMPQPRLFDTPASLVRPGCCGRGANIAVGASATGSGLAAASYRRPLPIRVRAMLRSLLICRNLPLDRFPCSLHRPRGISARPCTAYPLAPVLQATWHAMSRVLDIHDVCLLYRFVIQCRGAVPTASPGGWTPTG
jgi:hypothetical protein